MLNVWNLYRPVRKMDEELENFIRERKARVAEDKASLEQEPPYMEIKVKPRRIYGSTVKENIPPRCTAQGKDESSSVGLPLGVEYEKKKQRLQHELRMDYRRYMAQLPSEDQISAFPKQTSSVLQRNAAVLTEDRGLHGAPRLSKEDEEPVLLPVRHGDAPAGRLQRGSDELELTEGGWRRLQEAEATEKSQSTRNHGRGRKENLVGVGREGWRSRGPSKNEDAEFNTGLIIGAADSDEALQRKKERYRQELQEQIAEQHRNKKRERDLELKVAATGANDPEKQPDRIRQFGLNRRKGTLILEPADRSGSSATPFPDHEKTVREGEMPRPEEPRVAFQSPLLEYSSVLGSLSLNRQPTALSNPSAMDLPRNPMFLPHPPSSLSEPYRSPYGEPHQFYGTRNLPDPNMARYAHYPGPGAGFPESYWNVPSGVAAPSQLGNHSPHSQHSGSSFPEPHVLSNRSSHDSAAVDPQTRAFPSERPRSTRDRILSYRDALKQQIQEQQERRRLERQERERYEAQLEADMKNHQPWGRGGGGAPLRDSTGNLIADLNQMHKQNEEAYSNPEAWQRRASAARTSRRAEQPDPTGEGEGGTGIGPHYSNQNITDRIPGFTHVQTSQFARSKVFASQPSEHQLQEQDKYKAYLKQQIEEKMRKKVEEREQLRLEEEREEKRLAEQRARIQREYEEEQERKKRKEMEQRVKNEELIQLAEQRKSEAERKKKETEEEETVALRRRYERERQARVDEVHREPSPPIPTLQRKHGRHQHPPRPPTGISQNSTAPLSERSSSGLQSPPVPACRNQLRAAEDHRDVFSELSALRRQLRSEQKRVECHLQQGDWEELDSPITMRHQLRPAVDVFDMARLRLQAPVRRPNSRNMEPRNLLRIHDSLQLKYPGNTPSDGESRLGSSEDAVNRRSQDYRDSYHQFSSRRSTAQDDYLDMSPPQQNDYLRSVSGSTRRGFLLESESAFIDPLGDASPVPQTPELERIRQPSARERRRLAKRSQQHSRDGGVSSQPGGHRADRPAPSGDQQEAERGAEGRSQYTTGAPDVSEDSSSPELSPPSLNHESSVETVLTDPWMRSGSSDALKRFNRLQRRGRLAT
ncbi:centrosome and spindle pole associated protein 1-like isoform X2 [Kryptolebias marmoratus]|uniref:centrosome and spindle pole associated protein 1-like isoform X2 n=1 Tax=Kryptolebias marmoratus TaxID=37003 RepID=UPI0007F909D3|nr:centrosome and spindle pole associated protein 1-like isoform X2 [Kryptolebias marmoratus]